MERKSDQGCGEGGPRLIMPARLLEQVFHQLQAELPYEAGGLLLGRKQALDFVAAEAVFLKNAVRREDRYMAEPRELIAALFSAKKAAKDVIATLHSHPRGTAAPSPRDLKEAFAYKGMLHAIVAWTGAGQILRVHSYVKLDGHLVYTIAPFLVTNS